ncbi:MAG TPA: GDP-mannose 4,6-dehydratase [Longimicrobiaceae bacterium]
MRVLVTGAEGFVGQHLLRVLAREGGHEVVAGYYPATGPATVGEAARLPQVPLDVTSTRSIERVLAEHRPEWIFHLAAQSSVSRSFADPLGTWEVNATGTLRLAEAVRTLGSGRTRMLVISSAEVYGAVPPEQQPIPETARMRPQTPYGASKGAAELAAIQAASGGGLEVVVARSFNHTGPGQDERFVFPTLARQLVRMRRGEQERVLRVGNLEVERDFLDVRDVVRAYRLLIERGENGTAYNVCSGVSRSLLAMVQTLVKISGTGARLEVDEERFRPVDIPVLYGDPTRLQALGWRAEVDLEQTFRDLLSEAELSTTAEVG